MNAGSGRIPQQKIEKTTASDWSWRSIVLVVVLIAFTEKRDKQGQAKLTFLDVNKSRNDTGDEACSESSPGGICINTEKYVRCALWHIEELQLNKAGQDLDSLVIQ